jgi:hypothetical protein
LIGKKRVKAVHMWKCCLDRSREGLSNQEDGSRDIGIDAGRVAGLMLRKRKHSFLVASIFLAIKA